ncbi:hypothetical protein TSTA_030840 [Talaromyces stipitatus ATCC 10500]|uniref:Uncharacterized protein n=1 Tax=Talaromyces stipitatus (strain ATCC 10500 / CBS 375.48 / QM 6759 / NRRL 1006) TaxID=441959 RepID=B8M7U2_TALSN|nr:uncharacterized protein TSTA_030840 [Talaromyces stipitatus ATCC 10500]EED19821.1 hypothetical protein TSTA_030840 [Talaromyces stipitatus ATCC 10500]
MRTGSSSETGTQNDQPQVLVLLASHPVNAVSGFGCTCREDPRATISCRRPFYVPPEGFESTVAGSILRYRTPPYPIAAFSLAPINLAASYQILYRTTNSFGDAVATVSTILVPHNADFTKLLSYQVAQDAANPNCLPSYAFQLEAATD